MLRHSTKKELLPCDAMLTRYRGICGRRVSVRLSQACIVPKRLNVGSWKQRLMIAQALLFSDVKDLGEIPLGTGHPQTEAPPTRGRVG